MVVQFDAIIVADGDSAGRPSRADAMGAPWEGADGGTWEGFLGARHGRRVLLFPTASELHAFICTGDVEGFDGHPAWPGIQRRDPSGLRADRDDLIALDDACEIVAQPLTSERAAQVAQAIRFVSGVAETCGDADLASHIDQSALRQVLEPASWFGGRGAFKAWRDVAAATENSWAWVLERVEACLDRRGDFRQIDTDGLFASEREHAWAMHDDGNRPYAPRAADTYSSLAIAAFVLAFVTSCGIPSVICGHLALREIERTGKRGRGLAVAALVLGYLEMAGILLLIVVAVSIASSA